MSDVLDDARRALGPDPGRALALARGLPPGPHAALLVGAASRRLGDAAAVPVLTALVQTQAEAWGVQFELGVALACAGAFEAAEARLARAVALNPRAGQAIHALADVRDLLGTASMRPEPDAATLGAFEAAARGDWAPAAQLGLYRSDVIALCRLADLAAGAGLRGQAEAWLGLALKAAPAYAPARFRRAALRLEAQAFEAALADLAELPGYPPVRALRAALRGQVGDLDGALEDYSALAQAAPDEPALWLSLGHALKTLGRQAEAVEAYRKALALDPGFGEAWWSLADLKTWRFAPDDIRQMRAQLDRPDLDPAARPPLAFALAKALEDAGDDADAFALYLRGNALQREHEPYDAQATTDFVDAQIQVFDRAFFAARAGQGCDAPDPIFILGLPRSGSTLVEQILASHSQVEATAELPDLTAVAAGLPGAYPLNLAGLKPEALEALGRAYLSRAAVQRRTDRPVFTDKFPNNFMHVGMIALILPRARILDVRRHPLACCVSGFKQLYARGQAYSYDLSDLGRYYRDYVRLMAHFDAVLPGRVHRLSYEALVEDPEAQVRAMLDYCGLDFEEACLRFHETRRAVRTASSEQVRRPLNRDGLDQWRRFEAWLDPLKAALGPELVSEA